MAHKIDTEHHYRVWGADAPTVLRHLAANQPDLPLNRQLGDTLTVRTRYDGVIEISTTLFRGLIPPMPDRWLVVSEFHESCAYVLHEKEVWRGATRLFSACELDGRGTLVVGDLEMFNDWIDVRDRGVPPREELQVLDAEMESRSYHQLVSREYAALATRLGDDARVLTDHEEDRFVIEEGSIPDPAEDDETRF